MAHTHGQTHTHTHAMSSELTPVLVFPACDDDCTGVLLDDLDTLHNHFLSVNLSDVTVAPYRQLVLLKNKTKDMQVQEPP